jgi:hypothetical protein
MAERVDVQELLNSYSRRLLHEFREGNLTSKVAFDRGLPREAAVREFFESRLPGRYGVGEGLIIDTSGGQSEQCDVVVFDREMTPHLSTGTAMSVWPFESVYGVIQVKSVLTENALDSAVANVGSFKCLSRPANKFAGGRGVYTAAGGFLNPPLGMLIAHALDGSVPTGAIQEVIKAAPREQQIDLYCILTGRVGYRTTIVNEGQVDPDGRRSNVHINVGLGGTEFVETDFGDGALAAFLLISISIMNGILLGDQYFYQYLSFLEQRIPDAG